jgi:hypothetical protein
MDGQHISKAWLELVDRKFSLEGTSKYKDSPEIRYSVGQGMGMLSSWAALAISHHFIIRICGGNSTNYRIIGDDAVIFDKNVYKKYLLILDEIGMKVNTDKTYICDQRPITFEIARNFVINEEVVFVLHAGKLSAIDRGLENIETLLTDLSNTQISDILKDLIHFPEFNSFSKFKYFLFSVFLSSPREIGGAGLALTEVNKKILSPRNIK